MSSAQFAFLSPIAARAQSFFKWWGAGLLRCLPLSVRRAFRRARLNQVVLEPAEGGFRVTRVAHGEREDLGHIPSDARSRTENDFLEKGAGGKLGQIVLRLPAGQALVHDLTLPRAAEENLRQVLGFEMDRHTPFQPDQVYYTHRVLERQPNAGTVRVRLIVVPRKVLDDQMQRLTAMGLSPAVVDIADEVPGVNLLEGQQRRNVRQSIYRLNWMLGVLALVLLATALLVPLVQKRGVVIELMDRVNTAQRKAEVTVKFRERLESAVETARFLVEKKMARPRVIVVLDELSRIIPDGTWVQRFKIKEDEVQLSGESDDASSLIQLLESSALFEGVKFRSQLTRNRRTGEERFSLSAQITGSQRP